MSMSNLQAYSPALFERLASGYFSVKVPFSGMPFHREAQLALLNALTQLTPMAECEKVTVRNGRACKAGLILCAVSERRC